MKWDCEIHTILHTSLDYLQLDDVYLRQKDRLI